MTVVSNRWSFYENLFTTEILLQPKTMKQSARIEKTAAFISKEGPQMEILLKTKQANNPQFSFMNKDDALYQYYRHVLMAIKTGRYKLQTEQQKLGNETIS